MVVVPGASKSSGKLSAWRWSNQELRDLEQVVALHLLNFQIRRDLRPFLRPVSPFCFLLGLCSLRSLCHHSSFPFFFDLICDYILMVNTWPSKDVYVCE